MLKEFRIAIQTYSDAGNLYSKDNNRVQTMDVLVINGCVISKYGSPYKDICLAMRAWI